MVKIKNKKLIEIFNTAKFNYWGIDNTEFIEKRVMSVNIKKNLTISLDCETNFDDIPEIMKIIYDYCINEGFEWLDTIIKQV